MLNFSLENEKNGLQRMKETYINGLDNMANIVQNDDILDTKRLFSSVKRDLVNNFFETFS